jgi:ornithine carbamoyltransferase
MKLSTKHFLTGEECSRPELIGLLQLSHELRKERSERKFRDTLKGKNLTVMFEKPSLRTRVSFSVAMQELGGQVQEIQGLSLKKEEPEDTIRVLSQYSHVAMVRTFEHVILDRMAAVSKIPVINGLSDGHHPCQILADLAVLQNHWGDLKGRKFAYIGDGNNTLHSLLLLLPYLGVQVHYACPSGYGPNAFIEKKAIQRAEEGGGGIWAFSTPEEAVRGVDAVATDVWASMGAEHEAEERDRVFEGYQVNEELMSLASPGALVLHCMPMVRGKEISDAIADGPRSVIFEQAEYRLHVQKAILLGLLEGR